MRRTKKKCAIFSGTGNIRKCLRVCVSAVDGGWNVMETIENCFGEHDYTACASCHCNFHFMLNYDAAIAATDKHSIYSLELYQLWLLRIICLPYTYTSVYHVRYEKDLCILQEVLRVWKYTRYTRTKMSAKFTPGSFVIENQWRSTRHIINNSCPPIHISGASEASSSSSSRRYDPRRFWASFAKPYTVFSFWLHRHGEIEEATNRP